MKLARVRRARSTMSALCAALALSLAVGAGPAHALSGPAQPAPDQLGGAGPCGSSHAARLNPKDRTQWVHVYQPTGGAVPRTGGTCAGARRPVVFMAHGFTASTPLAYPEVIENLVSNGHIVVYAEWSSTYLPNWNYPVVHEGFVQATGMTSRMDLGDVGYWGQSMGGGMTPWLVQKGAARGWGTDSLWMALYQPHYAYKVGAGPIAVPSHTRALVVGASGDSVLDNRIGIEIHRALRLPASQKQHVTLRSECRWLICLAASHFTDTSISDHDALDFFGAYRNLAALSECARTGTSCAVDLSYMGTWSDGVDVRRAVSTDSPTDVGPITTSECWGPLNPRPCP